eukprot:241920_1
MNSESIELIDRQESEIFMEIIDISKGNYTWSEAQLLAFGCFRKWYLNERNCLYEIAVIHLVAGYFPRNTKNKKHNINLEAVQALPIRIQKAIKMVQLKENIPPGINIYIYPQYYRFYLFEIDGPIGSPFAGGVFYVFCYLPETYPLTGPKIRFLTRIFHPNIETTGKVCLDILSSHWTPASSFRHVALSLKLLLKNPNLSDIENEIVDLWKNDTNRAHRIAQEYVNQYANCRY